MEAAGARRMPTQVPVPRKRAAEVGAREGPAQQVPKVRAHKSPSQPGLDVGVREDPAKPEVGVLSRPAFLPPGALCGLA